MTKPDDTELTAAELDAVQALLDALKAGDDKTALWWSERDEVLSALAKMRAQAAEAAKGAN